jgi:ABC-type Fe3+-hydroxamate transport system substrate-binding protein
MRTIETLGRAAGRTGEAQSLLASIRHGMAAAEEKAMGRERPRVLFSVMHSYQGLGYINEIVAVGKDGFFDAMIRAAGGRNVYEGTLAFPRLSRESLFFLNPDVIVDVIPANEDLEAVRRDWNSLKSVKAIRDRRLILLTDEADTVPGPRFVHTLARLSQAFHPDAGE